jgi:hypothetical protein
MDSRAKRSDRFGDFQRVSRKPQPGRDVREGVSSTSYLWLTCRTEKKTPHSGNLTSL